MGSIPSYLIAQGAKDVSTYKYREISFSKFIFDSFTGMVTNRIQNLQNMVIQIIQDTLPNMQHEIMTTCDFDTNHALSLNNAITALIGSESTSRCIIEITKSLTTKHLNDNLYLINKLTTMINTKSSLMHTYFTYGIAGVTTTISYFTYKYKYNRIESIHHLCVTKK